MAAASAAADQLMERYANGPLTINVAGISRAVSM